ncbi:hypothetical protein R2R35_03105 [Anaerocolumna sp. AGMB13020]|nr:hypothetical protein [Anaerocolumna sp. AGMB13020]WOO37500.1 hypothetical protein R2R35_03105 [Anaerocolumna sp. AGMB13020]
MEKASSNARRLPKGDTKIVAEDEILFLTDEHSRKVLNEIFG